VAAASGIPGRERLRVLSRVMRPSTTALLQRAGARPGWKCLDVGCGGGDVAFDLARMVLPGGHVVGTDIDDTKLALARAEAVEQHLHNIAFLHADALRDIPDETFDLVHARFLLSHLADPAAAVANMKKSLRPGGTLVLEDVDFKGYFCHPPHAAFDRYLELYTQAAHRKGGDPNLGRRLPELTREAGFEDIHMNVVQHASTTGEVKIITALTMENIADAVARKASPSDPKPTASPPTSTPIPRSRTPSALPRASSKSGRIARPIYR
jgi:ubiquinone/menaquinone biosynthesis C-methylase UbiE